MLFLLVRCCCIFLPGPSCAGVRSVKGKVERAWWAQLAEGAGGRPAVPVCCSWRKKDAGICEMPELYRGVYVQPALGRGGDKGQIQ